MTTWRLDTGKLRKLCSLYTKPPWVRKPVADTKFSNSNLTQGDCWVRMRDGKMRTHHTPGCLVELGTMILDFVSLRYVHFGMQYSVFQFAVGCIVCPSLRITLTVRSASISSCKHRHTITHTVVHSMHF